MGVPDAFSYRDDPSVPPFPDDRPTIFRGTRPPCRDLGLTGYQYCFLLVLRRWCAFGVPLPMRLCPRSEAHERFHVEIGHKLTGPIVRYRGWLES